MKRTTIAYAVALGGYLLLFFLCLASIAALPSDAANLRLPLLLVLVGPLLFPLRGLLHGRPYTHAWSCFMALFYMVIGIAIAAGDTGVAVGLGQTVAATLWFTGALLYARWASARTP